MDEEELSDTEETHTDTEDNNDKGEYSNNNHIEETNIFKINTTLKEFEYGKYDSVKFIEDLILENTYDNNLCSDISNIDLIKYYTHKGQILTRITNTFIDNIMLYKLSPHTDGKR